jgi:hypothetical protein
MSLMKLASSADTSGNGLSLPDTLSVEVFKSVF